MTSSERDVKAELSPDTFSASENIKDMRSGHWGFSCVSVVIEAPSCCSFCCLMACVCVCVCVRPSARPSVLRQNGRLSKELDLVSHHVRTRLDELKRQEVSRLRMLLKAKLDSTNVQSESFTLKVCLDSNWL